MKRLISCTLLVTLSMGIGQAMYDTKMDMPEPQYDTRMGMPEPPIPPVLHKKVTDFIDSLNNALRENPSIERIEELMKRATQELTPEQLKSFAVVSQNILRNLSDLAREKKQELIALVERFKDQALKELEQHKEDLKNIVHDMVDTKRPVDEALDFSSMRVPELINRLEREDPILSKKLQNYLLGKKGE